MKQCVWILAGEASGDLYGARLARAIWKRAESMEIRGMGGQEMQHAGVDCLVDSTELGVVGLVEVLRHYPMFKRIFDGLVRDAAKQRPAAVVLIDYPGFNVRFAKQMHRLGIPVVYYISPQVWAWGKRRIPLLAKLVRRMLVIFPFEPQVYAGTGLDVRFVGHPLVDILESKRQSTERDPNLVLLLPGSRRSEIERLLPAVVASAQAAKRARPELRCVLSCPRDGIASLVRESLLALGAADIEVDCGRTTYWMQRASAGIAASGTVTVQAAILGLPLVVVYRVNWLTYLMARSLIQIEYITMVNLVRQACVFEEFVQAQVRPDAVSAALLRVLPGGDRHESVVQGMRETVARLRTEHDASAAAAVEVLDVIAS